ncbi:hypothetical protein EDE04_0101 [Streptomyces sp. 2132.2]|nr:hypothetical protein EDE04_0101 [Streptomyces sp. 2132.2]
MTPYPRGATGVRLRLPGGRRARAGGAARSRWRAVRAVTARGQGSRTEARPRGRGRRRTGAGPWSVAPGASQECAGLQGDRRPAAPRPWGSGRKGPETGERAGRSQSPERAPEPVRPVAAWCTEPVRVSPRRPPPARRPTRCGRPPGYCAGCERGAGRQARQPCPRVRRGSGGRRQDRTMPLRARSPLAERAYGIRTRLLSPPARGRRCWPRVTRRGPGSSRPPRTSPGRAAGCCRAPARESSSRRVPLAGRVRRSRVPDRPPPVWGRRCWPLVIPTGRSARPSPWASPGRAAGGGRVCPCAGRSRWVPRARPGCRCRTWLL